MCCSRCGVRRRIKLLIVASLDLCFHSWVRTVFFWFEVNMTDDFVFLLSTISSATSKNQFRTFHFITRFYEKLQRPLIHSTYRQSTTVNQLGQVQIYSKTLNAMTCKCNIVWRVQSWPMSNVNIALLFFVVHIIWMQSIVIKVYNNG